jgi:hypothetical protein
LVRDVLEPGFLRLGGFHTVTAVQLLEHLEKGQMRTATANLLRVVVHRLIVVVPYESRPQAHYDRLVQRASRATRLPYPEDGPAAHMAASIVMVERRDHLVTVWDGKPAGSFAGTADVVAYARQLKVPVTVIWPPGAARVSA